MTQEEIRQEFDNKIRNNFIKNHLKCQYCGKPTEHIHHLIPIVVGGDNRESNLIPLCGECHGLIHNKHFNNDWKEAQRIGIERAKAEGKFKGGQPKPKPDNWLEKYNQWKNKNITKVALAAELGITRPTLDKWIREEQENESRT